MSADDRGFGRVATAEASMDVASAVTAATTTKRSEPTEAVVFWLFVTGLGWVPFWNGSNELITWGTNAILFPGLVAIYEISLLIRGKSHSVGIKNIALPAVLVAAVALWTYFQTLAWSHSAIAHPIWGMAADALGGKAPGSISVNGDLTNLTLLRLITAAAVFWTALQLCRTGARANLLVKSIAAIGCAYAVYGLVAVGVPSVRLPWLGDAVAAGRVSSTFINRNSFATYAGLGLMAIAGLTVELYREEALAKARNRRLVIAALIETSGQKGAALLGAGFVILVALLVTGSRGGVSAAGLGLFVLAMLTPERGKHRAMASAAWAILGFLSIAALLFAFGDPLVGNLMERGLSDASRVSVDLLTIRSILDVPFLGHGYGTFADVFPMYRDRSISVYGTWLEAHNTYLEIFQGLGLVFGSLLLMSVFLLVLRCVRGATARRENAMIPRVAAGAAFLVGVHSLVDFSLQIQAVALTFLALLGAGVAQAESSRLALHD